MQPRIITHCSQCKSVPERRWNAEAETELPSACHAEKAPTPRSQAFLAVKVYVGILGVFFICEGAVLKALAAGSCESTTFKATPTHWVSRTGSSGLRGFNEYTYRGSWGYNGTFKKNERVWWNNKFWRCSEDNTSNIEPGQPGSVWHQDAAPTRYRMITVSGGKTECSFSGLTCSGAFTSGTKDMYYGFIMKDLNDPDWYYNTAGMMLHDHYATPPGAQSCVPMFVSTEPAGNYFERDIGIPGIDIRQDTRREFKQDELCYNNPALFGGVSWKDTGTITKVMTGPDSMFDALGRATVTEGTSSFAYLTSMNYNFDFTGQGVRFTAFFPKGMCPGSYRVKVFYGKRAHGSTDPWTPNGSDERQLTVKEGDQETRFDGDIKVPDETNVDVTVLKLVAVKECRERPSGDPTFQNGSVEVSWPLGPVDQNTPAGSLLLNADQIDASLYTPAVLRYSLSDQPAVELILSPSGGPRQINAPQCFVDIVIIDPAKYEIRFYLPSQVGAKALDTGLYAVTGDPYLKHVVDNPDAGSATNRLRLVEVQGATQKMTIYTYTASSQTMDMSTGDGARVESLSVTINGNDRIETRTVRDASNNIVSVVKETYRNYPFGRVLKERALDPDGANLRTTYDYYEQTSDGPAYGNVKLMTEPSGRWESYSYDSAGHITKTVAQFLDSASGSADGLNRVTNVVYGTLSDQDGDGIAENLTTTTESLLGQEVHRDYRIAFSKQVTLDSRATEVIWTIQATTAGAAWNDASNLVTRLYRVVGGVFDGKPAKEISPDGLVTLCTYAEGAGALTATTWHGQGNTDQSAVVAGTKTVTTTDTFGHPLSTQVFDVASNLLLSSDTAAQVDDFGRPTRTEFADGTFELRSYACCGLESFTDRQGITTSYAYDPLGRLQLETRAGISIRSVNDPEGRLLARTRIGSDSTEIALETNTYDLAGRRLSTKDALDRPTGFIEVIDSDGHTVRTTTAPDGGTRIETLAKDGSPLAVSGTAVAQLEYEYGVDTSGVFAKQIRVGDAGEETEWTKNYTDFTGRAYKTVYADNAVAQAYYDTAGRLMKQVDPDGVTTLFAYNALGEQEYTVLDLDRNGTIDYSGTDRITRTQREFASAHGSTVTRVTTTVWTADNAADTQTISVAETSVDGMQSWQTVDGLTTHSQIAFGSSGARNETTTAPDNTTTTRVFANDLLTSETMANPSIGTLASKTYAYDAHNRVQSVTDGRNGAATYTYYADDQVHTVTTPDPESSRSGDGYDPQVATYEYDSGGRLWKTTLPDGGLVTNEYYPTGLLQKTSGARTYPKEYTFDSQGRLKTLKTWQDYAGNGGAVVTTWNYDPQRGWLSSKRYTDNQGPDYIYTAAGRLATRTWARGIVTTYGYDSAGGLNSVTYSDSTPAVALTYDRLGRMRTTTDAAGTLTRTYHASGQLQNETYGTTGLLANLGLSRDFDAFDRLSNLGGTSVPTVTYGWDAASRLQTVTSGANSATYGYLANAPLVETVTFKNGTETRLTTTKAYDGLNRITSVTNTPSTSPARSVAYTYNSANQRTRATREDGAYWAYGYDSLGQVTSGVKHLAGGDTILGHDFGWTFDDIGNRKTAVATGQTSTYTPNALNQYSRRTIPGVVDVAGAANTQATVTVTYPASSTNVLSTTRQGELFYKQVPADNSSTAQLAQIKIAGIKNLVGPNGEDAVTEQTRSVFVPGTPEAYTYDADGNLTNDARWHYSWDGENRLVAMETQSPAVTAGVLRQKLEFAYDAQGRRIEKSVSSWNLGLGTWDLGSRTRFLYDGWNLAAELGDAGAVLRSYVWGLDLSGSLQGAGGVCGLLFGTIANSIQAAAFDGNGNVLGLIGMADGAQSAEYDYSAFGELVRADGIAAAPNPFRFSTKFADADSGLLYYGLRYYSPSLGRWLSRDPAEEAGGLNSYEFGANDSVNNIDINGLFMSPTHRRLTRDAIDGCTLDISASSRDKIYEIVADANVDEDGGTAFNQLQRHYNRPYVSNETRSQVRAARERWEQSYREHIRTELALFELLLRSTPPKCKDALQALGRVSHSWEDFFAHAVAEVDPSRTAEQPRVTSDVGFNVWINGVGGSTPDIHPGLWPSSYNSPYSLKFGEHPNVSEPAQGEEAERREVSALVYVRRRYATLLNEWLSKCQCWVNEDSTK